MPSTLTPTSSSHALNAVQKMISPCIQCGTCTGSCPNASQMDLTPRHMWRLVLMGRLERVMASQTFILCSDCYTCTLRCPRGLKLTHAMETLKGIAFARNEPGHRAPREFYDQFMQTVRRHGRVHEMEFMTRYFTAVKNPLAPIRFAPLGLKLLRKGKIELNFGTSSDLALGALFEKVAAMDREAAISQAKETHS